jgi:23S rRNA pseudouridine1911/1915/1917 synthase
MDWEPWRELVVPEVASGMRLDRFLARRFEDRSRSFFASRIRAGEVRDAGDRPLACSARVQAGDVLRIHIDGIAPDGPPPPFPPVLHEEGDLVAVDKPAGLLAHPTGTRFVWALISMAKARWNDDRVDLVHRLDRDTSGVLFLTRDLELNRFLKEAVKAGRAHKEYQAIVRGEVDWDERELTGPIGPADGPIRVQMAVRSDGLPARTTVTVLERKPGLSRVRCVLHTGRTHQIRVHLADAGFPLLGDRLYGVPPEVFLDIREHGVTDATHEAAGAPRHALHAGRTVVPLPDGRRVEVVAPIAPDMARWWADPSVLPLDRP